MKLTTKYFTYMLGLAIAISAGASTAKQVNKSTLPDLPTEDEVAILERDLILPKAAWPLSSYIRHYAVEIVEGKRYIVGILVATSKESRVVLLDRDQMPMIADGGCSVVNIQFSIQERKFEYVGCHGIS